MNIEISEEINQRLSTHRVSFETQEQVIERLLDHYEVSNNQNRPIVEFIPTEQEFKQNLVQKKSATATHRGCRLYNLTLKNRTASALLSLK